MPTRMLVADRQIEHLERVKARGHVRRIVFAAGPGDVEASWLSWRDGKDHARIPSIGYSQQIYELAEGIGAELHVLTQKPVRQRTWDGAVTFRHLPAPSGQGSLYHLSDLRTARTILSHARDVGADTIVMQRALMNLWPMASFPGPGRQLIFSLHTTLVAQNTPVGLADRLYLKGKLRALRRARGILTVGPPLGDLTRELLPDGPPVVAHIPQYPEAMAAQYADTKKHSGGGLIYVGRIETFKGVFLLLNAFEKIASRHDGARLDFIGEGGALPELTAAADRSVQRDRITVHGALPGNQVMAHIAQSDLLVCPTMSSFREGLAKTPLESAIVGVPSLMSSVVPAKDMVGEGGHVIPPDSLDALTEALDMLLGDPDRLTRMGQAARKAASETVFDRNKSLGAQLLRMLAED